MKFFYGFIVKQIELIWFWCRFGNDVNLGWCGFKIRTRGVQDL